MYKNFSLEQLKSIQTGCFESILKSMKKEGIPYFKKFLRTLKQQGNSTTYFARSYPLLRIEHKEKITIYDEKERIKIDLNEESIETLHTMLKNQKKLERMMSGKKSMMDTLREEFQNGEHQTILGKPYLIYDIETTYATKNLKDAKFIIAYLISTDKEKPSFQYISPNGYAKLYKYLLDFDGYIIGYNNIGFDNPVTVYNAGGTSQDIEEINKKSIDPFLFLRNITGKRRSLNKVSQSLIGLTKTLESGQEAGVLYNKYLETKDENFMQELKKYCKNDVKMTLLVVIFLIKYQKIYKDESEEKFTIEDFVDLGNIQKEKSIQQSNKTKTIF